MHHRFARIVRLFVVVGLLCVVPGNVLAQTLPNPNVDVLAKVTAEFAAMPEMIGVAKCESGFRQFAPSGALLRGGSSGQYVGIFQIDENIHTKRALSLGFDITTIDGNIGFAKFLRTEQGTAPWKGCLPGYVPASSTSLSTGAITKILRSGVKDPQVVVLQKLLNTNGFVIAVSGPGSAGNETDFFGALTREALKKFQCEKQIVCEGSEATTGFGRVGPRTRDALNALAK